MNRRTWKKQNSNPSAQFFVCITFGRKLKAINGNEYVCGFIYDASIPDSTEEESNVMLSFQGPAVQ